MDHPQARSNRSPIERDGILISLVGQSYHLREMTTYTCRRLDVIPLLLREAPAGYIENSSELKAEKPSHKLARSQRCY